ncbi:hypothetical protein DERF_012016 [Dermatophagoides farinae]|uniref:Uncharacterized protein n=1 Tax=Dermatophagoides farinae TaxID=6954 RepID=A0A922HNT7_DERFA|nr:hypothetical protein DERF_012016 [Dermatophagoides farinae]
MAATTTAAFIINGSTDPAAIANVVQHVDISTFNKGGGTNISRSLFQEVDIGSVVMERKRLEDLDDEKF